MTETTPISATSLGTAMATGGPVSGPGIAFTPEAHAAFADVMATAAPLSAPLPSVGAFSANVGRPEPSASVPAVKRSRPETPPEPNPILEHFGYEHLPPHLSAVSREFHVLAHKMAELLPPGPEKSAGLRKLLEAKDCAVRAAKP